MVSGNKCSFSRLLLILVILMAVYGTAKSSLPNKSKPGSKCVYTSDCNPPYLVCDEGKCARKPLFPMTGEEIGALFVMLVLVIVAICCSLSGGSIIVPIAILMIDFNAKQAVTLANAIVLLASSVKYITGLFKSNQDLSFKTIVDYNAAISIIPTISLFSTIGGMLATMFPDVFTLLLLVIFVSGSIIATSFQIRKMIVQSRKLAVIQAQGSAELNEETPKNMNHEAAVSQNKQYKDTERLSLNEIPNERPNEVVNVEKYSMGQQMTEGQDFKDSLPLNRDQPTNHISEESYEKEIEIQKKIDGNNFYYKKFGIIAIVLILIIIVTLFRGGKQFGSIIGIKRCSAGDWGLFAAYIVLLLGFSFYAFFVIHQEQKIRARIHYEKVAQNQVYITNKFMIITFFWSSFTGAAITIAGLGGGVLLTPYFIWMKYTPITASWTINITGVLSKVAAIVVAILAGEFLTSYVFFYGGLIALTMVIAENSLLILIKKMKSQVIILTGFVIILLISMILSLYIGIKQWVDLNKVGLSAWTFTSYC